MAMNDLYGFSKECELKAGPDSFEFVTKVFEYLPIAHIINDKVFVVHGGISPNSDMTIESLQKINRVMQPPEDGPLNDVLWSDPADDNGATAVRGGAVLFDSTMTHEFLSKNNLELLIRSHQVVKEGYRIQHDGKCITVFSAPNYVGKVGNLGCVMKIIIEDGKDLKYELNTFDALPFPFDFEPMLYCDMERFRC
ncbi:protein phosphatase-1 [Tritrichomonas foetus]|uniref:Protein phosphatase-1 n=1 Tax=Tritrichomonas foetus TaxID=1144522 RepID=A0A1J4L207_9EUKA|nr:protein phosphatase-1 [Tritrichomonas foetus]|eukprot:OHT17545.1 protein phosphatase-1 [Tritrichomonas foetus]